MKMKVLLVAVGLLSALVMGTAEAADKDWPVRITPYGGTLLLSDSPEQLRDFGVLYEDRVQGQVRLFFHHDNGMAAPCRLSVRLENEGTEPVTVTITRQGIAGPDKDYLAVGKSVQERYFSVQVPREIEVPGRGARELLLDGPVRIAPGELLNGMIDMEISTRLRVRVLSLPLEGSAAVFARTAKVLPKDQQRLRGTFSHYNRFVLAEDVYRNSEDKQGFILADGVTERYARGVDATDGSSVENYGNYGIVYRVFAPAATDARLWLSPQGGVYAGVAAVLQTDGSWVSVPTPAEKIFFGEGTTQEQALLQRYGDRGRSVLFSPPGASNLPVRFILTP